jgi:hypothetical protein
MAEEEGFEPPVGCPTTVFKTAAFDLSATPPRFFRSSGLEKLNLIPQIPDLKKVSS